MSRAALLPFPGDPFLLKYWLGLFDKVWGKEIDTLYIGFNSPVEKAVVNYVKKLCNRPNIVLDYVPDMADHGPTINKLLDMVKEDYVMLIEDDAFIFRSGMVDMCFNLIESGRYDIVGSKRGSCAFEILEAAKRKWGISYEGLGDQGPNFWPCYFFTKVDILKSTTRHFGARAWQCHERIQPLEYDVEVPVVYGDTFVNTSLELRAVIPESRIYYVTQYHAHPDDYENFENKTPYMVFDGQAPWTHIGSLSSGISGVLRDDQNRALARRMIDNSKGPTKLEDWCNSEGERKEWERRVCWFKTFYDTADIKELEENDMLDFYNAYGAAIAQIINQYRLRTKYIDRLRSCYQTLGL